MEPCSSYWERNIPHTIVLPRPRHSLTGFRRVLQYALVVGRTVSMHSLADDGAQLADMPHPSRVLCASFCGPHGILTGESLVGA